jgi:hypothetical protein
MMRTRLLAGMQDKELSRELQLRDNITLDQIKQQLRMKEIIAQNQQAELDGDKHVLTVKSTTRPKHSYQGHQGAARDGEYRKPTDSHKHTPDREQQMITDCGKCGGKHAVRCCPAYGKKCNKCKKVGHFGKVCRANPSNRSNKNIHHLTVHPGSSDEETFHVDQVTKSACSGSSKSSNDPSSNSESFSGNYVFLY